MAWEQCWLQYRPVNGKWNLPAFRNIWVNSHEPCVATGASELQRGLLSMFGLRVSIGQLYENSACPSEPLREGWISESIRLEIRQSLADGYPRSAEGFEISVGSDSLLISADTGAGILYACYALLRKLRLGVAFCDLGGAEQPANPLRMLNHWDNADGSIERGYAGQSFFLKDGNILVNERTVDYARLVSSVGINAVAINNVNVAGEAVRLITGAHFQQLQALAGVFASHAIRLFLCLDFAAPMDIGGLPTADPLDADVQAWWNAKMAEVFAAVPNLGGFVVKADSEGRPGPFTYGRTHADGANMLARAVKPYGGVILWRCFVYNCQQDWRDQKTDRARSGYDTFVPLNGQFDESVALQVKYGPMDFQVREPISPLLGAMPDTNQILELQITQEYTGQQKHICYLVPMWREILGFQTYCKPADHRVADIVAGKTYGNALCGIAAVSNTGDQPNWTGSDTAAANLYGYGRLCWDTTLSAEAIAKEWIVQTYSEHPQAVTAITQMLISSWPAYEKYTSPLGIGWMVNPGHHFGPNVDGYEYDRWGTYHRADFAGIGINRGESGTGYALQYFAPNREQFGNVDTCPEELLLFFHHVPYSRVLSTGKTVLQHIYDTHFSGVKDVEAMIALWKSVEPMIDPAHYRKTLDGLLFQLEHAKLWRDVVNTYFYRKTGIPDARQRKIYP